MTQVRPVIQPTDFARIDIECRVCGAMIECYVQERTLDSKDHTLHDCAFLCANAMRDHMMAIHEYPLEVFKFRPVTEEKSDG